MLLALKLLAYIVISFLISVLVLSLGRYPRWLAGWIFLILLYGVSTV